jgi:hypothetical protein
LTRREIIGDGALRPGQDDESAATGTISSDARSDSMNDDEQKEKPQLFDPLDLILGVGGAAAAITVLWLSLT